MPGPSQEAPDAAASHTSGAAKASPPDGRGRKLAIWLGALGAVVALVVLAVVLFGGGDDDEPTSPKRAPASAATAEQLVAVADDAGHSVYWAGVDPSSKYELTQTEDGRIFIRYLPKGVDVGDPDPVYLTVGTYPQSDAFETLKATAEKQGVATAPAPGGGLAFQDRNRPSSAYLAFPGAGHQVEIFDRTPGRALQLATSGRIVPVRAPFVRDAPPRAASVAELRAAGARRSHPVFWAGADADTTYELTELGDGRVYIRYLPSGVAVGSPDSDFLTVGTYPQSDPAAILRREAARRGARTTAVGGGGLAYVDPQRPDSVYVAYPRLGVQVEVFAAESGRALELVEAGAIDPVG